MILTLCGNPNEKVALMALTCLSVVVEQKATHKPIIDDDRQALPSLLALCKSENSQLQALALKCLTNLSLGSDWNKHRIVQVKQWHSQNAENCMHIKGGLLNQTMILYITSLFKMGTSAKGKNLLPEGANSFL